MFLDGATLSENDRLVCDFFWTFSRFEYALKASRFLTSKHAGADAGANWPEFAEAIQADWDVMTDGEFKSARDYIVARPPLKQIVTEHGLDWRAFAPDNVHESQRVLVSIGRIRNNLFHGGKSLRVRVERDTRLIASALTILRSVLPLQDDVKRWFDEET